MPVPVLLAAAMVVTPPVLPLAVLPAAVLPAAVLPAAVLPPATAPSPAPSTTPSPAFVPAPGVAPPCWLPAGRTVVVATVPVSTVAPGFLFTSSTVGGRVMIGSGVIGVVIVPSVGGVMR